MSSLMKPKNGIQCYVSLMLFALLSTLFYTGEIRYPFAVQQFNFMSLKNPSEHNPNRFNQSQPNTLFPSEIVPNIIHYLRIGKLTFSVLETTCILSAFHNHKPTKIIFHTDEKRFSGMHWENLLNTPGFNEIYEINIVPEIKNVFGQEFHNKEHASHVMRLQILREWGGIFLSNDAFIVRSLKGSLYYEMTLAADSNLLIIAHRDARLLDRWLNSYRFYDSHGSHRNGEIPPLLMYDELAMILPLNISGSVTLFPPTSEEFRDKVVVKIHETNDKMEKDQMIENIIQSVYPESLILQI